MFCLPVNQVNLRITDELAIFESDAYANFAVAGSFVVRLKVAGGGCRLTQ